MHTCDGNNYKINAIHMQILLAYKNMPWHIKICRGILLAYKNMPWNFTGI
jgi:hypothetical protein